MKVTSIIQLLAAISFTSAGPVKTEKLGTRPKMASTACLNGVSKYLWQYTPNATLYYDTTCNYPPAVGTYLTCVASHFRPYSKLFNKTLDVVAKSCSEYGGLYEDAEYFVSQYQNATKFVVDTEGLNLTATYFTSPVNLTSDDVALYYSYLKASYYNWDMPNVFASIFYFFFIGVFLLQGSFSYLRRIGYTGSALNNKVMKWYKCHISTPSLFGSHHSRAFEILKIFTTLLPTRLESIIVMLFIVLNVILSAVHYDIIVYSPTMTKGTVLTMFLADRSGLLAFGCIPLLVLFAGRNNLIINLTGVPYSTMIVYHKWVARMMMTHAGIHGLCWTAYAVHFGYLKNYYADTYWIWGVVATVVSAALCVQAFHIFRTMSYEVFLLVHIVLVCIFMVGCFYHCYDLGYLEWIYASWALWIADRLVRVWRIVAFGSKKADVELIDDETFRVSVVAEKFGAFPGCFAFVYFMTPYGFWQSHPFTVLPSHAHPGKIIFTIKPKKGMTKYLKRRLQKSEGKKLQMRVGVEGPYGHCHPTEKYSDVLLFAGGSGMPGLLAHALDLSSRDSIEKQNVRLIWVMKKLEDYDAFAEEIEVLRMRINVSVDLYVTGPVPRAESIGGTAEKSDSGSGSNGQIGSTDSDEAISEISHTKEDTRTTENELRIKRFHPELSYQNHRPRSEDIIKETAQAEQTRSLAIMTCGPPRMCDDIRAAASRTIWETDKVVDLFEELQVW